MELIRGLHHLQDQFSACVATIGNFDGVHLGHQSILKSLVKTAYELQLPSVVMSFEPLPEAFFSSSPPARLTTLREKIAKLSSAGIDYLLCIPFNQKFSELTPEAFIQDILIKKLKIQHLIVGHDFRFGYKRAGNYSLLKQFSGINGFQLEEAPIFELDGQRISSTHIRQLLAEGDCEQATHYLGAPFSIMGTVTEGQKQGRQLGFPTANMPIKRKPLPLKGVFAVTIKNLSQPNMPSLQGVANLGTKPTFGNFSPVLEVHCFNFNGNLYGHRLVTHFYHKIRSEQKFESIEQLTTQINRDVDAAKDYFAKLEN